MIKVTKADLIPVTFLMVLSASLAGNIYLGRIVRAIHSENRVAPSTTVEARTQQQLSSMTVTQSDGAVGTVRFRADLPTVVYIFSPSCSWCARNLENIRTLYAHAKGNYRFIGFSTGSHDLGKYLGKSPLPFPAYEDVSQSNLDLLDFRGTPQTIVVTSSGIVEHNWPGAYMNGTGDAVQKFFSFRLPGLVLQHSTGSSAITPAPRPEH